MKLTASAFCFFLILLSGCRDRPDEAYLEVTGKIFVFNYRVATATYVVTLGKLRALPDGAFVRARFDNPTGGKIIVFDQKVWPKLGKIVVESPPVFCIVKDKPYVFELQLLGSDGVVLQRLQDEVVSSLDQTVLPDRPLVVGPAYTPNPELAGRPEGKIPFGPMVKCLP